MVVRVTVDGIRTDTTAKNTINPKLWDTAKGKAYERSLLTNELNMYLDSIRAEFIRIHRDLEQDGIEHITAEAVVSRFLGRDKPERYTLLEVFREHNEPFHSKNTKKLKYNKFEFHIFTL
ncbi:Arm DNA-binding domain-containing protein [Dysgonomonas sp. ZJ709]|uniref:Arm DNA-binding domain-containing protein n=1 Tax=Dysgonomonas sp. ZJ709 TaxID=2709797 RepID=UPI0013EE1F5A